MSNRRFATGVIALAALAFTAGARAEDPPKPAAGAKADDGKKDEPKKDETTSRVERARKLVADLEAAIARAKAAQPIDPDMLQRLMTMLDEAKALAKPAKPEELTADEKKAVVDEANKAKPADAPPKPGQDPMGDWAQKQLAKAFEGADLSEDEQKKAGPVIGDWWKENLASMGDSKKQSDLKRKRDDDLERILGKKKAQKVINNLNSMGPGRR